MVPEARRLDPHVEVVEKAMEWVSIAFVALNLPLTIGRAWSCPQAYQPGFAAGVLGVMSGLLGWSVWRRARGRTAVTPLRLIVATCAAALALHPLVAGPVPPEYPPLFHVIGAGICVSPLVAFRFAIVMIPVATLGIAWLRTPVLGAGPALAEASLVALSSGLATTGVGVVRRANRVVVDAVASMTEATELALRASRQAFEREHWNGLVHDKVLGALQIAVRARDGHVPMSARLLAEESLAAFRGDPLSDAGLRETLQRHAEVLGLALNLDVIGEVSGPEVRRALVDAAKEALTNVARHSGCNTALVRAELSDAMAQVTITDTGNGFDPKCRPPGVGITTSLIGRMRVVNGDAAVVSAPGCGTEVHLSWTADRSGRREVPSAWQLRTFVPAQLLGAVAMIMNTVLGAPQWLEARSLAVSLGGIVLVGAITAVALWSRPHDRSWPALSTGTVIIGLVLTANINGSEPLDWRYWFLGALTPAMGAMAFRYRRWVGAVTALLLIVGVAVTDAVMSRSWQSSLSGPVPVLLAVTVAGHAIRAAMDRAWQRVTDAEDQRAQRRLATAVEEERSREAAGRVAALAATVEPVLVRLAGGRGFGADERADAVLLESSIRDHLAAPDLLDGELVDCLRAGRARGAHIVVRGVGSNERVDVVRHSTLLAYRRVLAQLLSAAPASATIRAVWGSAKTGSAGTVVLVGHLEDSVRLELRTLVDAVPEAERPRLTSDADAVLVEFPT